MQKINTLPWNFFFWSLNSSGNFILQSRQQLKLKSNQDSGDKKEIICLPYCQFWVCEINVQTERKNHSALKVSELKIELKPTYMKEILNEILQVKSREILACSSEVSGSILLIFKRYRFCSLFYQEWLGDSRQVAQDEVLKQGHLICKPQALDYSFKSLCPYRLRVHMPLFGSKWPSGGSVHLKIE